MTTQIILASSSPYRQQLLQRLLPEFAICAPHIDESPLVGETALALVQRLTASKLDTTVQQQAANAIVIASDQVAEWRGNIINKPESFSAACDQLAQLSGQVVDFHTGLGVACRETGYCTLDVITTRITYRVLSAEEINHYLQREPAWDCTGSFRCEGLGIALLSAVQTDDPTALVGLPLIQLTTRLQEAGVSVI